MKQFVVHLSDKQRDLMSESLIKDHVAYLRTLKQSGKLPFCGPCVDGTAWMVLNAASPTEAEELVDGDPFSKVNYYQQRTIVEIEEATLENNFMLDEVLVSLRARAAAEA